MVNGWKEPEFKGRTLKGRWQDCSAMVRAVDESVLGENGCSTDTVERFLAEYWIERDVNSLSGRTLVLVRQHQGYFQVRFFSQAHHQLHESTPESLMWVWDFIAGPMQEEHLYLGLLQGRKCIALN